MKKDKKALAQRATDYIVKESSIATGLKALYLEADAAMHQLLRADRRIASVFQTAGVTTKDNPELGALKNYYDAIKRAVYFFDEFASRMITDATWGANEGENKRLSYENWRMDANDLSLFTLLFLDRTYHDEEQRRKIFDTLLNMESHGQFTQDDFNYYAGNE